MRCPYCDVDNDRVLDSRASEDGGAIRRRRECLSCHERYTTYERVERSAPRVIKKDGTRVPFDRMKIQQGVERACWKLPVDESQVDAIVREIEVVLENRNDPEITSQEIGELVMEYLRELNQVAYIRFASVYRAYRNIRDFVQELQPMLEESRANADATTTHPPTNYRK